MCWIRISRHSLDYMSLWGPDTLSAWEERDREHEKEKERERERGRKKERKKERERDRIFWVGSSSKPLVNMTRLDILKISYLWSLSLVLWNPLENTAWVLALSWPLFWYWKVELFYLQMAQASMGCCQADIANHIANHIPLPCLEHFYCKDIYISVIHHRAMKMHFIMWSVNIKLLDYTKHTYTQTLTHIHSHSYYSSLR